MSQFSAAQSPEPYVPPPSDALEKAIRPLRPVHVLHWLTAAWRDLRAHPGIGAFYGLCFWLMALLLGAVFRAKPEYTMSIASGCLLLGKRSINPALV